MSKPTRLAMPSLVKTRAEGSFTFWERWALRQSHPVAIIFRLIGFMWAVYYLWHNDWISFLTAIVLSQLLAIFATMHADCEALGQSLWGRLALLHLHPVNVMTQSFGIVLGGIGVWWQDTIAILVGISIVILGHAYGWVRVHSSFALNYWEP